MTEAERERKRRFDELFRQNIAGIVSYCSWRSRSPGEEQDAVAEVFLIAWRRLESCPRVRALERGFTPPRGAFGQPSPGERPSTQAGREAERSARRPPGRGRSPGREGA